MFRQKSKPNDQDYRNLGKNLEAVLVKDYIELVLNTKRQIGLSLIRGFVAGLAGVIGATLGVAILISLLGVFGGLPLIGDLFKSIGDTIKQ